MIILLKEEDLEELSLLEKAVFKDHWTKEQLLYELKDNPFAHLYGIKEAGKLIAYGDLWILFERAEITSLAVHPAFQGKGLGKQLLEYLLNVAMEKACDLITLEVRASNQKARQLYYSHGFEDLRIRKAYYQDDHEDAVEMMKVLVKE